MKSLKLKKFICLLLLLCFCILFTGCSSEEKNLIKEPLKEVHAVYDLYDNLIQQTVFNEQTGEYITTVYTYENINGLWTCINQNTTILNKSLTKESTEECKDEFKAVYNLKSLEKNSITLVDSENIKISLIEYLTENNWRAFGYRLKLENKTNKVLCVILDNNYIMNIKCSPVFTVEHIEPSETKYFELSWDKETLERRYVPYVDNVEFMIRIYNNENWKVPALEGAHILLKH